MTSKRSMLPAEALAEARRLLLAERPAGGPWTGELSTSALSTATALFALHCLRKAGEGSPGRDRLIQGGLDWLASHQNGDGGWGDTVKSFSNISTTALAWAALGAAGETPEHAAAAERAGNWIRAAAGTLEPAGLAKAIADVYGKDRTFSVPILTMCALAGRLGEGAEAWRLVPALPFELAAFPRQWLKHVRLPVVSYALPALIAIGQVRFHSLPPRNPAARWARSAAKARTLSVLEEIQPSNGGFLEAAPLTSFVTMSLASSGLARHPVARKGAEFLESNVRPDGSWPIDTNLSAWTTSLAICGFAAGGWNAGPAPDESERAALREWILGNQTRTAHPFTGAAPGAWSWTPLPGGVPDADDTPAALLALAHLEPAGGPSPEGLAAAAAGIRWLLDLQNSDGGIPTFCRGWGLLPFDRSGADLTAHALRAWAAWRSVLEPKLRMGVERAISKALRYLEVRRRPDGSWLPLWFGNQHVPGFENPVYGTSRVVTALAAVASGGEGPYSAPATFDLMGYRRTIVPLLRGVHFLLAAQNEDGGWGGASGAPSSAEETSLALEAMSMAAMLLERTPLPYKAPPPEGMREAIERGAAWLAARAAEGTLVEPSPIGFYFANLWYYEKLYPLVYAAAGLGRAVRWMDRSRNGGWGIIAP